VASDELKLALILAISTGQRQGDLLRMTWGQYDGAWINHRQSKGKKQVAVPIHRDLKKVLDQVPRRSTLILTTPTGLPWKSDWFRNRWRDASKAAGIKDLHFHDLRGTAVTMLAEAGCSNAEIAAITGHSMKHVETILTKYVSLTRDLAQSAMAKLENAESDFSGFYAQKGRRSCRVVGTSLISHKQTFLMPPDHRLKAPMGTPWHPLRCVVRLHRPHSLLFVCFYLVKKWLRVENAFAVPADKILFPDQSEVRCIIQANRNE